MTTEALGVLWGKLTLRKRWQWFEFDDQPWLPQTLRRVYMEVLGSNPFRSAPFARRLRADLAASDVCVIHSLCSGNGQFVYELHRLLKPHRDVRFILSDLFPLPAEYARIAAQSSGALDFIPTPVDATAIRPAPGDWFLMAGSLHHLREADVAQIFARITENGGTLVMMENHDRSFVQAVKLLLIMPGYSILASIFGRPFRPAKLLFGALLPIVPLMITADALVSNFRSYRPEDLRNILRALPDAHGYAVKADRVRYGVVLTGAYFVLRRANG